VCFGIVKRERGENPRRSRRCVRLLRLFFGNPRDILRFASCKEAFAGLPTVRIRWMGRGLKVRRKSENLPVVSCTLNLIVFSRFGAQVWQFRAEVGFVS